MKENDLIKTFNNLYNNVHCKLRRMCEMMSREFRESSQTLCEIRVKNIDVRKNLKMFYRRSWRNVRSPTTVVNIRALIVG